jgi:hypothetical protein
LQGDETLILEVRHQSGWLGRFLDPRVELLGGTGRDGRPSSAASMGVRYLNLTGLAEPLRRARCACAGAIAGCRAPRLWITPAVELRKRRVMVIAPHADDAELAAYGLYSQADETWVVTLTAGEIEAEHYQQMGLQRPRPRAQGRLRAWDSIAVPRWAGVPESRCVQLGYFCLQLPAMQAAPDQPPASREADMADIRLFRQFNPFPLPGDRRWCADLAQPAGRPARLLELARPKCW